MGCLMSLIGLGLCIFGFILTVSGAIPAVFLMLVGAVFISIGNAIMDHIPVNKLFAKGDIVGKNLKYIESIIGQHTDVDVSNNNARVYKWQDRLEIICDKNNVCKEVLKRN